MTIESLFPQVQRLEAHLGDPLKAASPFSYQRAAQLDEREEFPAEFCELLEQWGFHHYYVPQAHGGALGSYEQVLFLIRAVARRDLTLAIGHGKTFLGCVCVWVGGSADQRARLAEIVLSERGQVSLGLTEREHGSDLMATEVTATPTETGFVLDGEKWLINNATRSRALTVLAAVPRKRRRVLSLFLVDKRQLAPASFAHTPKNRTLGIRGADISGIRFTGATLDGDALIGRVGGGLGILMRSLYLTRSCVSGLALGAADTGLRCVLDFALARQLYGAPVWDIPHFSRTLAECFADTLMAECVAITASRCLNLMPGHARMVSACTKYFVPATAESVLSRLSVLLGARFFLRDEHWHGVFQRMFRDSRLLGLFDGSSVVNLRAIGMMVASLPTLREQPAEDRAFDSVFQVGTPVPALDPTQLTSSLTSPLGYMEDLDGLQAELAGLSRTAVDQVIQRRLVALLKAAVDAIRALEERLAAEVSADGMAARSYQLIEHSRRFCDFHAVVCGLRMWLACRDRLGGAFAAGAWLVVGAQRLVAGGGVATGPEYDAIVAQAAEHARDLYEQKRLFSVASIPVA